MRGSHYSCFGAKGDGGRGTPSYWEVSALLPISKLDCSYHKHDHDNPQSTYTTLDDSKSQLPLTPTPLSVYLSIYLSIYLSGNRQFVRIRWKYFQGERTSTFTHLPINQIDQIKSNQSVYERGGGKKEGRKEGTLFQFFHLTLIKPLRVSGWSGSELLRPPWE